MEVNRERKTCDGPFLRLRQSHSPCSQHQSFDPGILEKSARLTSSLRMSRPVKSNKDDKHLANSTTEFLGRHENHHQTTRKTMAGAPHEEKRDSCKECLDVSNTESQVSEQGMPSSPKMLLSTEKVSTDLEDDYRERKFEEIVGINSIGPEVKISKKTDPYFDRESTDGNMQAQPETFSLKSQQEKSCFVLTRVDNKLLEKISALPLQDQEKEHIKIWASQNVDHADDKLASFIQLWNDIQKLPVDKLAALTMAKNLSQQNLLTNGMLSQIYSCLQKSIATGNLEENTPCSDDLKSLLKLKCCLKNQEGLHGDVQNEDRDILLKENSLDSLQFLEVQNDFRFEQHFAELAIEDAASRSPVENSFYFSTFFNPSANQHPFVLSRYPESNYCKEENHLETIYLSLLQDFVGVLFDKQKGQILGSEPKRTQNEPEMKTGCEKAGLEMQEKVAKVDCEEISKEKEMAVEAEQEVCDKQLDVVEKSEFEELEKEVSSVTKETQFEELQAKNFWSKEAMTFKEPTLLHGQMVNQKQKLDRAVQKGKGGLGKKLNSRLSKKKKKQSNQKTKGRRIYLLSETTAGFGRMQWNQDCFNLCGAGNKLSVNTSTAWQELGNLYGLKNALTEDIETNLSKPLYLDGKQINPSLKNCTRRGKSDTKIITKCTKWGKSDTRIITKCTKWGKYDTRMMTSDKTSLVVYKTSTVEDEDKFSEKCRVCQAASCPGPADKDSVSFEAERADQCRHQCLVKDKRFLSLRTRRLDIQRMVVKVRRASDGSHGGSDGNRQGNSSGTGNKGEGGTNYGGARPKMRNNGNGGGGRGRDEDDENNRPPRRNVPDSLPLVSKDRRDSRAKDVSTLRDYKRFRKKQHGAISNEQLCHCLGQAGQGMLAVNGIQEMKELDRCLTLCLHNISCVTSPMLDDLTCCTCVILHSLLSHFSVSAHGTACDMCLQLFTLVHFHVQKCLIVRKDEEQEEEYTRNICLKMRQAELFQDTGSSGISSKVWTKVRKYLSAALSPVLLLDMTLEGEESGQMELNEQNQELLHPNLFSVSDVSHEFLSAAGAESNTQTGGPTEATSAWSSATPIIQGSGDASQGHAAFMPKPSGTGLRRRPSAKVIPQKTIPEESVSPLPSMSYSLTESGGEDHSVPNLLNQIPLPSSISNVGDTPEDGEDIMKYIRTFEERTRQQAHESAHQQISRKVSDDPYATNKTYGDRGTVSMPDTRERLIKYEQNLSVEMKPVGVPGIGEVVYGTRQQLLLVARNWRKERDKCKSTGYCMYQHREEGVILHAFKKQLKILHTRYQKHQQWERLVHLGNGVTGKCHLCIDRSSNFKFCCKKMHILHYEDQELHIWSELSHHNIVGFYGAIRHAEKIYMFAEFIDGGSLAAMIKEQWLVGRRLSHWTALNYFRQLLDILTYLESMGILHEDIKADNLLLRDGTTEIVLADFGLAQQIPHDHTPPNRYPAGSPAHWSPEKAASEGHGFGSDLWAAACVLIHMLSGSPPWVKRFPDAAILNYLIWSQPPPIDDVPENVKDTVRDLLKCCLVKDQAIRPRAKQILGHQAFQLLDHSSSFFSNAQTVATVLPTSGSLPQTGMVSSQPPPAFHLPQSESSSEPASNPCQAPQHLHSVEGRHSVPFHPQLSIPLQEGAVGYDNYGLESVPSRSAAGVAVNQDTVIRPPIRVVEIPRQACTEVASCGRFAGPLSLPGSLPSDRSSALYPETHSKPERPLRKSAPAISAPFSVKDSSDQQFSVNSPQRAVTNSYGQQNKNSTLVGNGCAASQMDKTGTSKQESNISSQQNSHLEFQMKKTKGFLSGPESVESLVPLQPEMWPEIPSPVLPNIHLPRLPHPSVSSSCEGASMSHHQSLSNAGQVKHLASQVMPNASTFFPADIPPANGLNASDVPRDFTAHNQSALSLTRIPLTTVTGTGQLMAVAPMTTESQTGHFDTEVADTSTVSSNMNKTATSSGEHSLTIPGSGNTKQTNTSRSTSDCEYKAMYPTLSAADFNLPHKPSSSAHCPNFLSVIPEAVEQESGSSMESSEGVLWNYIEDQLSAQSRNQEQILQSLQAQSEIRPRLPLYAPSQISSGNEVQKQQNIQPLPRFELLHSMSDTSTQRSSRNISSIRELSQVLSQCQSHPKNFVHVHDQERHANDEPDNGFIKELERQAGVNIMSSTDFSSQSKQSNASSPLIYGSSDEDRISSGDIFGSGPSNNKDFEEAVLYRQQQQQLLYQETHAYQKQTTKMEAERQQQTVHSETVSPIMARRNPNLRLNVPTVMIGSENSSHGHQQNQGHMGILTQSSTAADLNNNAHSQFQGDDGLLCSVSPLTASPLSSKHVFSNSKHSESKTKTRNDSGSSVSTPKSATYDQQLEELVTLQMQTPELNVLLMESNPNTNSFSEPSSAQGLSLLFEKPGDGNASELEKLSLMQEEISENQLDGQLLEFIDQNETTLFVMRVRGKKSWKDLATTFRVQIRNKASFEHFSLLLPNGLPVDCFALYDPAITIVKVIEISEERSDINDVCWCDSHFVF